MQVRESYISLKIKSGAVTIHDNQIVYGVNMLESGVRYGFFMLKK